MGRPIHTSTHHQSENSQSVRRKKHCGQDLIQGLLALGVANLLVKGEKVERIYDRCGFTISRNW